MKEILTQLFGEAVTDEALKTFNAELGKKFVAKADFNAKGEEIKTLKAEKQSLEDEIAKLNETAKGGEDVKAELEALKAQIESDKKQAEAERIRKTKLRNMVYLLRSFAVTTNIKSSDNIVMVTRTRLELVFPP